MHVLVDPSTWAILSFPHIRSFCGSSVNFWYLKVEVLTDTWMLGHFFSSNLLMLVISKNIVFVLSCTYEM